MAVCNLFKKITNNSGNFFLFSQYTEDLIKSTSAPGYYRVVPSKFIAANIDYGTEKARKALNRFEYSNNDPNIGIPLYLQNCFENGCAEMRNQRALENPTIIINEDQAPNHWSTNMFWNALFDDGFLSRTPVADENTVFNVPEIKYVGDINIQSYDEHDGMGYSEIYCFIPSEAYSGLYTFSIDKNSRKQVLELSPNTKYVNGYETIDNWSTVVVDRDGILPSYRWDRTGVFSFEENETAKLNENEKQFFQFNTIIVLYDVMVKDAVGNIVASKSCVPMGMYLTGTVDDSGYYIVNNICSKYTNNPDIFQSGTSYGLRISSRFTATPNEDYISTVNTSADNNSFSAFCEVMSTFADTQEKLNAVLDELNKRDNRYKELFSIFKNGRTNVPYVKNIGGTNYWFVNGRNLGSEATLAGLVFEPYTKSEIYDMLDGFEEALIDAFEILFKDETTGKLVENHHMYFDATNENVIGPNARGISFTAKFGVFKNKNYDVYIEPDKLTLEGDYITKVGSKFETRHVKQNLLVSSRELTWDGIFGNSEFRLHATKGVNDEFDDTATTNISFINPGYYGFIQTINYAKPDYTWDELKTLIIPKSISNYDIGDGLVPIEIYKKHLEPEHRCILGFTSDPHDYGMFDQRASGLIQYMYPAIKDDTGNIVNKLEQILYLGGDAGTEVHEGSISEYTILDVTKDNAGLTPEGLTKYYDVYYQVVDTDFPVAPGEDPIQYNVYTFIKPVYAKYVKIKFN